MMHGVRSFFAAIFRPPTITDVIEHEMSKATQEITQANTVIHNHRFQLHMAKARIEALTKWNQMYGGGDGQSER